MMKILTKRNPSVLILLCSSINQQLERQIWALGRDLETDAGTAAAK